MSTTIVEAELRITLVCAWCRRDTGGAGMEDPRAIVGLCDDHVAGFSARVEDLLTSCAELGRKRRKGVKDAAEVATRISEPVTDAVGELLRSHGGLTLCDACIAAELGWPAARVTAEAESLETSEFLRDQWRCARCGARGVVTRARVRRSRILEKQAA